MEREVIGGTAEHVIDRTVQAQQGSRLVDGRCIRGGILMEYPKCSYDVELAWSFAMASELQ